MFRAVLLASAFCGLISAAYAGNIDDRNPVINNGAGVVVGAPTGGNLGAGTVNATGVFVNGQAVGGGLSVPNACVIGGTGTALSAVALGTNLTCTNGTLNATGGGGGSGTVTTTSVNTANGFSGTVANATTTPAITITVPVTGLLKGNGTGVSAATAGTDYIAPGGALGTPASGTLTNATGLPISSGVSGLGTGVAAGLASTASGTGSVVLGTGGVATNLNVTPTGGTQTTLGAALGSPSGNVSGATAIPTGAPSSATLAALAAQQGVLLDAFKVAGDADDTASMTRAVAAGVPILLGPRTYTINNYSMAGTPASFVLIGRPGRSIIQRTNGSVGSQFFNITATNAVIDGVTFDMNSANVTANQWGVLLSRGGQNVTIRDSVFENNSGSLSICLGIESSSPTDGGSYNISSNEITGCTASVFGSLYLGTASHGIVSGNYIHDNGHAGIFAQSNGTATATNYITDVIISNNRVERNGGTGISVGGFSPPYSYAVPPATHILVEHNSTIDNADYGIFMEGDYCNAIGNQVAQSSPSVVVFGGIDNNGSHSLIQNNTVVVANSNWGIDIGGSTEVTLQNNLVAVTQGSALNVWGNINSLVSGNHAIISGTANGISVVAVESGGGAVFPNMTSGLVIENNIVDISGASTIGIQMVDNPGGYPGATPTVVRRNSFNGGSAFAQNAIVWYGSGGSLLIEGNQYNGTNKMFSDPLGNGDVIFENVYFGGTISGASSTTNVRSLITRTMETYGLGGSVLYVTPAAGGSGYTAATVITISGTGCTGQIVTPLIISGVIVGTRMSNNFGSGCSGTVTAAATDTGGGSGATFTVGNIPKLPTSATITYLGNTNYYLLQRSGGQAPIGGPPIVMSSNVSVQLQATGSNTWDLTNYTIAALPSTGLPACNATSSNAVAAVTDALTPTYGGTLTGGGAVRVSNVECNGTNWLTF